MFDENTQKGIETLLTKLHEHRDYLYIVVEAGTMGALNIRDATLQEVQTRIAFNGASPNGNLAALRRMVLYARDRSDWEPIDKALIYGAYMHVVHDLYAGMVFQPGRFGYGFAVEADSTHSDALLYYPELYYEFFTQTGIPTSSTGFVKDAYIGLSEMGDTVNRTAPAEFLYLINILGQVVEGWQDIDYIVPVGNFVEAANAPEVGYGTSSLTFDRLRAYMHGWGITLFMTYGYTSGTYANIGGMPLHPSWNFGNIRNFWTDIINANTYVFVPLPVLSEILQVIKKSIIHYEIGQQSVPSSLFLPAKLDLLDNYSDSWPSFFETVSGIDKYWSCVPDEDRTEEVWHNYYKLRRIVQVYDSDAQVKKPNLRNSYLGELENIIAMNYQYRNIIDGTESLDYHMDGISIQILSRKAGLLGGIYPINPARDYYHQPGVVDMCFEKDGNFVYTEAAIPIDGDPSYIDLKYDLVTFGPTQLLIYGKKPDGSYIELTLTDPPLSGLSRQSSTLPVNAQDAINQGIEELSFRVKTQAKTGEPLFALMFNSDYRDAYNSDPEIYNNPLYQDWFKGDPSTGEADPTRDYDENPHSSPKKYWPYVLSVTEGSGYHLYAPSNLLAYLSPIYDDGGRLRYYKLQLYWTDNSNYEHGQQIWENDYLHRTVGPNVTTFTKNLPNKPGTSWSYKVRAYRDEGYYSHFSNTVTVTIPSGGGCPFIYTFNGSEFVEDNNILAGSDVDSGEVTEYYKLEQSPMREENRYFLQVREFEQEHTYLDKIELMAIDHPCGVKVGVSTEGDIVIYDNEVLPIDCVDTLGQSHLALILERDSTYFQGFPGDELIVDFGEIEVNNEDALHFVIIDKVEPPASVMVSIYKDGDWHRVGRLLHRRNWWSQMVYPLEEGSLDSLKVKLTWYEEQKLDYVALAKVESEQFITKKCPLLSATHSDIGSIKQKLLIDDENYAELLPGDTITLEFTAVDIEPGWIRDFVFVSNGYYITETGGGAQTAYSNIPLVHFLSLYPNPARNDMTIRFGIPREEKVSLKIYDISGREIKTLVDDRLEAGYHTIRLDGKGLPSGIYFARLVTDGYEATKKLVLMK